jgi:hypothetical protein
MIPTLANSATQLMHLTLMWVLVGNILIGIVEGLVLARLLDAPLGRSIVTAVAANYASAWAGFLLLLPAEARATFVHRLFAEPISHPYLIVALSAAFTFGLSVAVETPVLRLISTRGWRGTLGCVAIANTASHLLLLPFFLATTIRIERDVRIVPSIALTSPLPEATVYFLDDRDGSLLSVELGGPARVTAPKTLASLGARERHDVLIVDLAPPEGPVTETNPPKLVLRLAGSSPLLQLADRTASPFRRGPHPFDFVTSGWWLGATGLADLRPDRVDWRDTWPSDSGELRVEPRGNFGIRVGQAGAVPTIALTFDTPFGSWYGRSITRLTDDIAVFEFGNQICLLSIPDRTLAPIARGRGPVVVLKEPAAVPSSN